MSDNLSQSFQIFIGVLICFHRYNDWLTDFLGDTLHFCLFVNNTMFYQNKAQQRTISNTIH